MATPASVAFAAGISQVDWIIDRCCAVSDAIVIWKSIMGNGVEEKKKR